jgi:hypothetical protein
MSSVSCQSIIVVPKKPTSDITNVFEQMSTSAWAVRLHPLEALLQAYKLRHLGCIDSPGLPHKYILVRSNNIVGMGNQFPSIISGERHPFVNLLSVQRTGIRLPRKKLSMMLRFLPSPMTVSAMPVMSYFY